MNTPILTLKVTLRHTLPRVWRRLIVPGNITLARFHPVIQTAMGWTDASPHYFADENGVAYSSTRFSDAVKDGRKAILGTILDRVGKGITYHLGLEEDWEHEVNVESIEKRSMNSQRFRCIGGALRCPPPACGGPLGFRDFLANLQNQRRPRIGFDPHTFRLAEVNSALRRLRG